MIKIAFYVQEMKESMEKEIQIIKMYLYLQTILQHYKRSLKILN